MTEASLKITPLERLACEEIGTAAPDHNRPSGTTELFLSNHKQCKTLTNALTSERITILTHHAKRNNDSKLLSNLR